MIQDIQTSRVVLSFDRPMIIVTKYQNDFDQ